MAKQSYPTGPPEGPRRLSKAKKTVEAAQRLLDGGHFCDAASRAYYAAFQAAASKLERLGKTPADYTAGKSMWGHGMVQNAAWTIRQNKQDQRDLRDAYSDRTKADYDSHPVSEAQAKNVVETCSRLVEELTP